MAHSCSRLKCNKCFKTIVYKFIWLLKPGPQGQVFYSPYEVCSKSRTDNTILLADKDRELCNALEKYLTRYGYDVTKTETGTMPPCPPYQTTHLSVIISGTHLQDMRGVELLRELRKKFPQIQVSNDR